MTEPRRSNLRGHRILIVEDDFLIAADLAEALESFGVAVVGPAGSVKEALREIEARSDLDGAVLDINLTGEKIFAVSDALRSRGVPFIFATGYSYSAVPAEYADVPRCEKPVQIRVVVQLLGKQIQA